MCFRDCCWSQHIYLLNFALALAMYVDCWDHSEFSLCPLWQVFSLPGWCHLNNWLADIFERPRPRTQSYIQTEEIFILIDMEQWDQHSGCSCSTGHKAMEEHTTQRRRLDIVKVSSISTGILKLNAVQGQIPSFLHTSRWADVQFYLGEHWNVLVEEEITRTERMNLSENRVQDLL